MEHRHIIVAGYRYIPWACIALFRESVDAAQGQEVVSCNDGRKVLSPGQQAQAGRVTLNLGKQLSNFKQILFELQSELLNRVQKCAVTRETGRAILRTRDMGNSPVAKRCQVVHRGSDSGQFVSNHLVNVEVVNSSVDEHGGYSVAQAGFHKGILSPGRRKNQPIDRQIAQPFNSRFLVVYGIIRIGNYCRIFPLAEVILDASNDGWENRILKVWYEYTNRK